MSTTGHDLTVYVTHCQMRTNINEDIKSHSLTFRQLYPMAYGAWSYLKTVWSVVGKSKLKPTVNDSHDGLFFFGKSVLGSPPPHTKYLLRHLITQKRH